MTTVGEVFDAAMALTDELNLSTGSARTRDTKEYEQRTPQIIGTLIAEFRLMSGLRGSYIRPESLDDNLIGIDDGYAIGVMQYGLAAKLLLDENPASASFFHEKYEELRSLYFSRAQATVGEIENVYGGIEYGQFSHW
ncbi:MAG: hypothetical protein II387_00425 [Oscillospiraceae bacterium]|nr:hypothetical protein [Oscillospiraceae bacterium]